jgi:hypothetical protein
MKHAATGLQQLKTLSLSACLISSPFAPNIQFVMWLWHTNLYHRNAGESWQLCGEFGLGTPPSFHHPHRWFYHPGKRDLFDVATVIYFIEWALTSHE